jgi:hypothetical protein
MPDNPTRHVDLSWFYMLDLKDRVEVLARTGCVHQGGV